MSSCLNSQQSIALSSSAIIQSVKCQRIKHRNSKCVPRGAIELYSLVQMGNSYMGTTDPWRGLAGNLKSLDDVHFPPAMSVVSNGTYVPSLAYEVSSIHKCHCVCAGVVSLCL